MQSAIRMGSELLLDCPERHRMGEAARGFGKWASDARATMGANIREYLQEESRDVVTETELEMFNDAVDKLRNDVDRLAAKLQQLKDSA